MEKLIYRAAEDPAYAHPFIDEKQRRSRRASDGTQLDFLYVHGALRART